MLHVIDPVAFNFFGHEVRWYGIIIAFGILIAYYLADKEAIKQHLPKDIMSDLIMWIVPAAIIGARIYYVAFEWSYYRQHPAEIIAIWSGGIAIHGAIIAGIITLIVFCYKKYVPFFTMADILAPSLMLGQIIGRWGNFFNHEAHGGETTLAFLQRLHLPQFIIDNMYIDNTYYHPTFLYESLWNLLGLIIIIFILRKILRRGEIFASYLIWYSVGRYFIEGMRTDALMLTSSLRIAQVISIVIIVMTIIMIIYRRKHYQLDKYNTR